MIGRSWPVFAAAVMALCVGCSSSASEGRPQCAPCPPPVGVSIAGVDWKAADGGRIRICVGDLPCVDSRVTRAEGPVSCDSVGCSASGANTLNVTLGERGARRVAAMPVLVTAWSGKERRQGAGTMAYTPDSGPCPCEQSHAHVSLG
ncbi:hypothetical protein OHR68_39425 [Spirillospora sp. NBC_00431]